jgi:hypothetical protein
MNEFGINVCTPLSCEMRSPNTNTLCVVFEDADTAVECFKVDDTTCSSLCPPNMDPLLLPNNTWICTVTTCDERVPINTVCVMPNDAGLCYSLEYLNRCYTSCPSHTTINTTNSNNPKCTPIPCNSRTPDSKGACLITSEDECYKDINNQCVSECVGLMTYNPEEKVREILF